MLLKRCISETHRINNNANPNTLWEVIKGNIRNETIKFASNKKRKELEKESKTKDVIENLEHNIQHATDLNVIDQLKTEIYNIRANLIEIID